MCVGGATEKKGRRRVMKGPSLWAEHSPKKVGPGKDQHGEKQSDWVETRVGVVTYHMGVTM